MKRYVTYDIKKCSIEGFYQERTLLCRGGGTMNIRWVFIMSDGVE